jgi:hypothetical protein
MAHFPQPHTRVRAPRVRVPSNESLKLNLGKASATVHRLSLTGGLVQFNDRIGELALTEVVLTTPSGPVAALVEFLKPATKEDSSRAFRFVALDDTDFNRLVATLQFMRKQEGSSPRR